MSWFATEEFVAKHTKRREEMKVEYLIITDNVHLIFSLFGQVCFDYVEHTMINVTVTTAWLFVHSF